MELKELRKPETTIDWSKHKLNITKNENVLIHDFKKPGTCIDRVVFINSMGVCSVTGDYGNWIFCREFHPNEEGWVSRGYWQEKLEIASSQKPMKFDSEATRKELESGLKHDLEEQGWKGKELQEMKEYYESCLEYVDDENDYEHYSYNHYPDFTDFESVILIKECKYWLKAVFDAFNEICNRIQKEKEQKKP